MNNVMLAVALIGLFFVECQAEATAADHPRQPKFGFLTGATNMIGSLAQDIISRSATSSQVLSLNLTNLVILMVLKAIIFGASSFGFGHGGHGRSADGSIADNATSEAESRAFLTEHELLLLLSYLQADSTEEYDCLQRFACEAPSKAKEYVLAGKVFLKGSEFVSSVDSTKYAKTLSRIQEAVSDGLNGENCQKKYQCSGKKS